MLHKKITKYGVWVPYIAVAFILFLSFPVHITNAETTEAHNDTYTDHFTIDESSFEKTETELIAKGDAITESNAAMSSDESAIAGAGVNAGTLIVIVLLACITVILLYSFVFKRKK